MNDANELREMVKTLNSEGDNHLEETVHQLEKSADILIDSCKVKLEKVKKKHNYFKGVKEICISFGEISSDFTKFKKLDVEVSKKKNYFEKEVQKTFTTNLVNYLIYADFDFSIKKAKVPISCLEKKDYTKLTLLKKILEERGFFCCVHCGWDDISFAIVLKF